MLAPYTSVAVVLTALVWVLPCLPTNTIPEMSGHEKLLFQNVTSDYNVIYRPLQTEMSGHEKLLFQNVTSGYNVISRPVRNASRQVQMTFGISLNQIIDLDEKHQTLSTYVWIYEKWMDENLQWQPAHFNGLEKLMFPATVIWVPDIYIFNTAGSSLEGFVNVSGSYVVVSHDGHVEWSIPLQIKSACPVDATYFPAGSSLEGFVNVSGSYVVVSHDGHVEWSIPLQIKSACPVDATYFPYDKQQCNIYFGSWIYDYSQIDINLDVSEPDLSNYVINNEFDLAETALTKSIIDSSCCPGNGEHPIVHLKLYLARKTIYYDYIVIAPTINLCVLTLATFLLPCECGWKIAIGLTVFLTLYVLQLLIAENVPDTNSTPLISVFLLLVMSLNCISLIMATIIMNIRKRSQHDPIPKVPPLLLTICEKYLSKVMCTKMSDWKKIVSTPSETNPRLLSQHRFRSYRERILDEYREEEAAKRFRQITRQTSGERPTYNSIPTQPPDENQTGEYSGLGRTQTAESSFSTQSGNGIDVSADVSCTDKLWDSKKHQKSPRKHHPNVNHSFTIEQDEIDEMTITPLTSNGDFGNHDSDGNNVQGGRRQSTQKRPSYKRAIHGGTYTSLRTTRKKAPKLRRRRILRKPTFLSSVDRKYQWYFVADVIDTTTFLVYIVVMFVGIMTVLVIVPLYA